MPTASRVTAKSPSAKVNPRRREVTGLALTKDGTPGWVQIANRDPSKHYVLANLADTECGASYYESMGYTPVPWEGLEKPRLKPIRSGHHIGDPQQFRGQVLMQISLEEHERLEREGEDGTGGQAGADFWENLLKSRKGKGVDTVFDSRAAAAGIHEGKLTELDEALLDGGGRAEEN